jgi:hypothetical protein
MSHLGNLSGLVGFLLPLVIAMVQQERWRPQVRAAIGFAVCLAAALLTVWAEGELTGKDYLSAAIIIFTVAKASYVTFWKSTGIAPAIEHHTNFGGPHVHPVEAPTVPPQPTGTDPAPRSQPTTVRSRKGRGRKS